MRYADRPGHGDIAERVLDHAAVDQHGKNFKDHNGWVAGLEADTAPTLPSARTDGRPTTPTLHYRLGSQEIHSYAKGWVLNTSVWGDQP